MYFALVLLTIALLFGASSVAKKLDAGVKAHNLRFTGEIKNAPVLVTFTTVALGSFRGLIADILWLRSEGLKAKKSYFEMKEINDMQSHYNNTKGILICHAMNRERGSKKESHR